MSTTKERIYNLTLSALMLTKEVIEIATDKSNVVRVLNTHYDTAFQSTLQDLDLDMLASEVSLELLATLVNEPWQYVYKYPTNCIFMRSIKSLQRLDTRSTFIPKKTGIYNGQAAIFTNEATAVIRYIPKDVPLAALSPMATLTVAYKLAFLSAPLVTGKGAKALRKEIKLDYIIAKAEAQETDALENFSYDLPEERSEFVEARLS